MIAALLLSTLVTMTNLNFRKKSERIIFYVYIYFLPEINERSLRVRKGGQAKWE